MEEKKGVSSLTVSDVPEDVPTLKAMLIAERMRNDRLMKDNVYSVPMILSYQPYIPMLPQVTDKKVLWDKACSSDSVTAGTWKYTWLDHIERNVKDNKADECDVGKQFGAHAYKPCLCVASGPSLKKNFDMVKDLPEEIPVISCLHNFHLFVDTGTRCTAFLTLDAGDVTIKEVTEGGKKTEEEYWAATKDYTLIAGLVSPPELIKRWQGPKYFFNATIPDEEFMNKMPAMTTNRWVYSVGGNTFGACMYHAAWVWGCRELALIGADFAFDYTHKFHAWDTDYDKKFAGVVPCTDVFGNRVYSWPSYQNFRAWTEFQCQGGQSGHHCRIINCTEGGTLGAYAEGNVMYVQQLRLCDWIDQNIRWKRLATEMKSKEHGEFVVMW